MNNYTIPKKSGCAVYMIFNVETVTAYVGKSKDIKKRAETHKTLMKNGKHPIEELNQAYKDSKLFFLILHRFDSDKYLLLYEKLYMYECLTSGIKLYNKACVDNGIDRLKDSIIFDMTYYFDITKNLKNTIKNKFYTSIGMLLRDKYRYLYYKGRDLLYRDVV